jgi:hypothetical protein
MSWWSTKDCLPELRDPVLLYDALDDWICLGHLRNCFWTAYGVLPSDYVTHWHPLAGDIPSGRPAVSSKTREELRMLCMAPDLDEQHHPLSSGGLESGAIIAGACSRYAQACICPMNEAGMTSAFTSCARSVNRAWRRSTRSCPKEIDGSDAAVAR